MCDGASGPADTGPADKRISDHSRVKLHDDQQVGVSVRVGSSTVQGPVEQYDSTTVHEGESEPGYDEYGGPELIDPAGHYIDGGERIGARNSGNASDRMDKTSATGGEVMDMGTILTEVENLGKEVLPLIPGVGQYEAALTLAGGIFNTLYAEYQARHGATGTIKTKAELLGIMAADTAEVAAEKIP